MSEERSVTTLAADADGTADGVYVYCIIESGEPRTFGKIGIGARGSPDSMMQYT